MVGWRRSAAENFWFDELDYSVWFENLREEGGTYVFNNEEDYVLQLNTENLADKKDKEEALYRFGWEVGTRSENDERSAGNDRCRILESGCRRCF